MNVDEICKHIPNGFQIDICMEEGKSWVVVNCKWSNYSSVIDDDNLSIDDKLNKALVGIINLVNKSYPIHKDAI